MCTSPYPSSFAAHKYSLFSANAAALETTREREKGVRKATDQGPPKHVRRLLAAKANKEGRPNDNVVVQAFPLVPQRNPKDTKIYGCVGPQDEKVLYSRAAYTHPPGSCQSSLVTYDTQQSKYCVQSSYTVIT